MKKDTFKTESKNQVAPVYVWEVSLEVSSPLRHCLKHQLNYTVQAEDKKEAIEKAKTFTKQDGNTFFDVISIRKKFKKPIK